MIKCPVEWPNMDAGDKVHSKMPFQKRKCDTAPYYHHKWKSTGHQQIFFFAEAHTSQSCSAILYLWSQRARVCPVVNPKFPTISRSHPATYSLGRPVFCLISTRQRSLWPNTSGGKVLTGGSEGTVGHFKALLQMLESHLREKQSSNYLTNP